MKTIEAKYRIVTPMFIGDANQQATSIRPPSIKGALRFWWRAIAWGRFYALGHGTDQEKACSTLEQLHAAEATLFGSAASHSEHQAGQSKVLISIENDDTTISDRDYLNRNFAPQSGAQYLLGQGLYHFRDKYSRAGGPRQARSPATAITAGQFQLRLLLKPSLGDADVDLLCRSVIALGTMGGLGSRARKGFGSLALQSISADGIHKEIPSVPQNVDELQALLRNLANATCPLPPFTAFSRNSCIVIAKQDSNAWSLLEEIGSELQMYRAYGRADGSNEHKVAGKPAEQNFQKDHDLTASLADGTKPEVHPRRVVFGLPHNYYFSSDQRVERKVDIGANTKDGRRASPLIIHIHSFNAGDCAAVLTYLPASFLPDGAVIAMEGMFRSKPPDRSQRAGPWNRTTAAVQHDVDWEVIKTFLARFNKRVEVLP